VGLTILSGHTGRRGVTRVEAQRCLTQARCSASEDQFSYRGEVKRTIWKKAIHSCQMKRVSRS
jgi:hypothetical protein